MTEQRIEMGMSAQNLAAACDVPDPGRVVRVTFDGVPRFVYGDGRVFELPPITVAGCADGSGAIELSCLVDRHQTAVIGDHGPSM